MQVTGEPTRAANDILGFVCVRNELERLPYFLNHHRAMGVDQFYIVDNGSDDGTAEYATKQPDVTLFSTTQSYRDARFGMDWLNGLLMRYGAGHWCLTLDADEALVIPHQGARDLHDLTAWLDERGALSLQTIMVELYAKGPISHVSYTPGQRFEEALPYYDAAGYRRETHPVYGNTSIRGGPRERVFFQERPDLSPHLQKTPLIKWHWRYAYASSTHIALPTRLNSQSMQSKMPTGALLHAKFLPDALAKTRAAAIRKEHFTNPTDYDAYYGALANDPDLWHEDAKTYAGWEALESEGLMGRGDWR
ncbi:glycosyltransferase family 2 protein [Celeribacter arenosi]|uniref:glycosyltransferase family 2 protein n=1 Tax=Celeribacter arenosi TaxID=792649 RepID=UPI0031CE1F04